MNGIQPMNGIQKCVCFFIVRRHSICELAETLDGTRSVPATFERQPMLASPDGDSAGIHRRTAWPDADSRQYNGESSQTGRHFEPGDRSFPPARIARRY